MWRQRDTHTTMPWPRIQKRPKEMDWLSIKIKLPGKLWARTGWPGLCVVATWPWRIGTSPKRHFSRSISKSTAKGTSQFLSINIFERITSFRPALEQETHVSTHPPRRTRSTHSSRSGKRLGHSNQFLQCEIGRFWNVQECWGTRAVLPMRCGPVLDMEKRIAWGDSGLEQKGYLSSDSEWSLN